MVFVDEEKIMKDIWVLMELLFESLNFFGSYEVYIFKIVIYYD